MTPEQVKANTEFVDSKSKAVYMTPYAFSANELCTMHLHIVSMRFFIQNRLQYRFLREKGAFLNYVSTLQKRVLINNRQVIPGDVFVFSDPSTLEQILAIAVLDGDEYRLYGRFGNLISGLNDKYVQLLKKGLYVGNACEKTCVRDLFEFFKEPDCNDR